MIKQLRFVFVAGALVTGALGGSGAVMAQSSCSSIAALADPAPNSCGAGITCLDYYQSRHPECFGSSSNTAAAAKSVQATTLDQMLQISSAISARTSVRSAPPGVVADSGQRKGLAAGSASKGWNLWASLGENTAKFDRGTFALAGDPVGTARTNRFDTRIQSLVIGGDYQWLPNVALGLSGAFDNGGGSTTTGTAAGGISNRSLSSSGYSFAPYLGWQINKDWALDASMGWGKGKSTSDGSIKTDTTRLFYGANLGYTTWLGPWQMTGKGSYLWGQEKSGDSNNNGVTVANSAATNEIGQFRLAGQVAYWMNGVMPYGGLAYASDARSTTASAAAQDATAMGNSAWVWSLGLNFISLKNSMTGGIAYEQETGRSRSKNDKLMANINVRF